MRKIIFRGKDKESKDWRYGLLICSMTFDDDKEDTRIFNTINSYEVYPNTVGLYTGIKDRNGTEIFEDDIVEYYDMANNKRLGTIKWIQSLCRFEIVCNNGDEEGNQDMELNDSEYIEIKGNIHEVDKNGK